MSKKLIVFDIDGTLLTDEKKIADSTKEAMDRLAQNGHEFVIATGRNVPTAQVVFDEIDLENFIVCNGAAAYYHGEKVYENPLAAEDLERLFELADQEGHQIIYETPELMRSRFEKAAEKTRLAMDSFGGKLPPHDFYFYQHYPLVQNLIFYEEQEKDLYENGQFPHFRFVRWHEYGVDVLPKDGSKANTVELYAQKTGYSMADVVTFGDGMNDLEMLKHAGMGVAMGNAPAEVRRHANMVTDSNNNDGIYKALKQLQLI